MMQIAPTITAENPREYQRQMTRIAPFAQRIHIDVADGVFAPRKLLDITDVWWPEGIRADLHVMYTNPFEHLRVIAELHPSLVIIHAEAEGSFEPFANILHHEGIRVGIALLPSSTPKQIMPMLEYIDHVLVFGGKLGFQGGKADLGNLDKVKPLTKRKPSLEVSWDGGINHDNVRKILDGGVDVLNVGGYIANAINPYAAYATLETIVDGYNRRYTR